MRVPVRPPARPVATTGTSSRLSARATLMPLPPASARTLLARCRCPSLKIGTVSERSSAALRVTVTITGAAPSSRRWSTLRTACSRDEPDEMVHGAPGVPPDLPRRSDRRNGRRGDERRTGDQPAVRVHPHLARLLTASDRQGERRARDDTLDERSAPRARCGSTARRGDELDGRAAVADLRRGRRRERRRSPARGGTARGPTRAGARDRRSAASRSAPRAARR